MTQNTDKCLRLYSSNWREKPSFKMMPTTSNSVWLEAIYDPFSKSLFCILKHTQKTFRFLPRVDKNGDFIEMTRPRKYRNQESRAAEERLEVDTPAEFILEKREEIESFINRFVENTEYYDYQSFLDAEPATEEKQTTPEQQIGELTAGLEKAGAQVLSVVKEE